MTNLKLIEIEGGFPSWQIDGTPFGIEKIDHRDYVVFRLWGKTRVYIRDTGFSSRDMACLYLADMVEKYNSSIIELVRGA